MSSSRDDRYYASSGKSRRTPPGDSEGVGFFQNFQGQGGRTVLPPISRAFPGLHFPASQTYPNQYSQPRSSPGYNTAIYNQWPNTAPAAQPSSFPFYDTRYPAQPSYPSYSSRTPPVIPPESHGSRRLPPLNTREERWQTAPYTHATTQVPVMNNIRSPTAGYPPSYAPYPTNQPSSYSYPAVPDPRTVPHALSAMGHQTQHMHAVPPRTDRMTSSRNETRSASPYGPSSSAIPTGTHIQHPAAPPAAEEPVIKKKRKRADAAQLRVLNDTYNRTAFPSTEERAELAKKLDMSARSVQIWFQNKRQSMRQTSRQTSAVSSTSHRPFAMTSHSEAMLDDDPTLHASVGGYATNPMSISIPGASPSYMPRSPQDNSRSAAGHASSTTTSSHRRHRSHDDNHDPHKWSGHGGGY